MSQQDDGDWQTFLQEMQAKAQQNQNPAVAQRMLAVLNAQAPPPPGNNAGTHNHRSRLRSTDSEDDSNNRRGHYEKVHNDIPIQKFPYGKKGANWKDYAVRFLRACKTVTNAATPERVKEIALLWIPLKLPEEAQPIYQACQYKDTDWDKLVDELDEGMEDPLIRRNWVRDLGAYKKPEDMTMQVYKANVHGYVTKYSPGVLNDPKALETELYNRFVHGLEPEMREDIDSSIPYGKETIDRAYNQAIKYELKAKSKQVSFTGAAMSDSERDHMQRLRLDMAELKTSVDSMKRSSRRDKYSNRNGRDKSKSQSPSNFKNLKNHKNSPHYKKTDRTKVKKVYGAEADLPSDSGKSGSSTGRSRSRSQGEDYRAIQTEDEDSDSEAIAQRTKAMADAISRALTEGMKGLSVKSRKGSSSSTASAASAGRSSKSRSRSKKE